LLPTPKEYSYADTTENSEPCTDQPDSKNDSDERHNYQRERLPSACAGHFSPHDEGSIFTANFIGIGEQLN
jgi:hypothetical protein